MYILDGVGGVRGIELVVDKFWDVGFFGVGIEFICWD